ncbi:MAG: undecaprenyldiphospho-muramoylpentapeptide beta-N-acetylglucosaminyltransferase [Mollicutes bacterium]|nr:undecaprenyldiphospho-muramoylpentapeptide beta-N-acetylglucosaminyltransferase [Mollicutes bacterium]
MNVIISAGGTGGHIYPAVAIINKLKEKEKDLNVLYIGTHNRMEKDIIPSLDIKYEALEIYGFSKKKIFRNIKNIFLVIKAYNKCKKIIKEFMPDVVIGAGGYVTMPVILAANKLGIKTCIHEQNSIPGKTNKWLGMVDLACISYENSRKYLKAKKIVYTGNPCGENAINAKKIAKETLGFKKNKKLILIVSGSLGSTTLNDKFKNFLHLIDETDNFEVLYITGKDYYKEFIKNNKFSKSVKCVPYLDNLSGFMKNVDLVISRAGAGIISELLALEIPSIMIPSPYVANNHQYYNALDLKEKGVAILIEEKDFDANLVYLEVKELLDNNTTYIRMKTNLKSLDLKNASVAIYEEIKELINNE